MKSILFICDLGHCPHRIPGWAEELSNRGWTVNILSPKMTNKQKAYLGIQRNHAWKIDKKIQFPMHYRRYFWISSKLQRIYAWAQERKLKYKEKSNLEALIHEHKFNQFAKIIETFSHLAWYKEAVDRALQLVHEEHVSVVISSSSPIMSHLIAHSVSIKGNVKWIADYRDLWSLNHTHSNINELETDFEAMILRNSSACLTATDGMSRNLSKLYDGPICTIHNAFEDNIQDPVAINFGKPIRILYTGTIYEGFQDIEMIYDALKVVNSKKRFYVLDVYGFASRNFKRFALRKDGYLPSYIKLHPHKSMFKIRKLQRSADLLLFLDWKDNFGFESTKLIEYLSKPGFILGTGLWKEGAASSIIRQSGKGKYFTNTEDLIMFLDELATQKSHYPLFTHRDTCFINKFSFTSQVEKLANLIESLG